jgi:hypothetical protein
VIGIRSDFLLPPRYADLVYNVGGKTQGTVRVSVNWRVINACVKDRGEKVGNRPCLASGRALKRRAGTEYRNVTLRTLTFDVRTSQLTCSESSLATSASSTPRSVHFRK